MAGKSNRFPNMRPKWLLTHPAENRFMATESIQGINLDFFDKIIFVCLVEHEDNYHFMLGFAKELEQVGILDKTEILFLCNTTKSQSETVAEAIIQKKISGFIFVKDPDGFFNYTLTEESNQICYYDLNDLDTVNARAKSYLKMDSNHSVSNIVEKEIISSTFSVGGYGFEDAALFLEHFNKLQQQETECYPSHIIFDMMLSGNNFTGHKVKDYEDWGTLQEWNKFRATYKTLFLDIDGVLLSNTSDKIPPLNGTGSPLKENLKFIQELHSHKRTTIILTTGRRETERSSTIKELKEKAIPFDQLIMNLPHGQRIVINDFANSNPFPSARAINLKRDDDNLKEYF